jgi:hypothetical protein
MKKVFKMSVRIIGTEKVFAEGFEPGVFVTQELHYDLDPAEYERTTFLVSLMDKQAQFLKENAEVLVEEVKDND